METIPFLEFSLYQMFHIFIFWAFIGWGIEVCYMTLETGEYQNRGFLNMPICPIYGFGVLMVTIFFRPLSNTVIPLFLATAVLCTTFELLVGLGMEKLFDTRWWDYSHERFNFRGYICMKVSILWGMGCVIVIRLVEPMVEKVVDLIPINVGLGLILLWSVLIVIDLISSICAVNALNNRLKQIDEISKVMLVSAVKIGGKLSKETLEAKDKYDKLVEAKDAGTQAIKTRYEKIVNAADFKLSEWEERYDKLINLRDRSVERLIKAFPYMRSVSYSDSMEALKRRLKSLTPKGRKLRKEELAAIENIPEGAEDGEQNESTA